MGFQRKPDITDEEIGMNAFRLKKAKAVERSIERVRQGLGKDWSTLSMAEYDLLKWALGEVWAYVARAKWDRIAFSSLTMVTVKKILDISQQIIKHEKPGTSGLEEIYDILEQLRD